VRWVRLCFLILGNKYKGGVYDIGVKVPTKTGEYKFAVLTMLKIWASARKRKANAILDPL